jgi:hypothetical protein
MPSEVTDIVLRYLRRRADALHQEARAVRQNAERADSFQAQRRDEERYARITTRAHALTTEADLLEEGTIHAD